MIRFVFAALLIASPALAPHHASPWKPSQTAPANHDGNDGGMMVIIDVAA